VPLPLGGGKDDKKLRGSDCGVKTSSGAEALERGLLWRRTRTNIDGRYVLSWAANPRAAIRTDLLPLVFSAAGIGFALRVQSSRVPIESCIKTTTLGTIRALEIFFFRCHLSASTPAAESI